ncbi:MAG: HAD-IA family hydrolase, partial [Fervidobacterium sp.]|nr:HAD-IA family hydrolase [Fervidobacterium sp.]
KGAEELNLKPEECIVFEDAIAGIEAAKKANMKVIGVGSKEILKDADMVIEGFKNVSVDIIKAL